MKPDRTLIYGISPVGRWTEVEESLHRFGSSTAMMMIWFFSFFSGAFISFSFRLLHDLSMFSVAVLDSICSLVVLPRETFLILNPERSLMTLFPLYRSILLNSVHSLQDDLKKQTAEQLCNIR